MKKINYKSDFDAVLKLKDARGNEIPFPDCDWEAIFWTFSKSRVFRASCIGGECVNCIRENDGRFRVVFNGHGIGVGILKWEPHFKLPDTLFPDGIRDVYVPMPLDIELVTGAGDYPTTAEVEASLPLIKGDKGDRGDPGEKGEKGDGFTPAQIAKLDELPEAEALSARIDAAARRGFVDKWLATLALFPDMPTYQADVDATLLDGSQFGLNGYTDIGYTEAQNIMLCFTGKNHSSLYFTYSRCGVRTLFPIRTENWDGINMGMAFANTLELEKLVFAVNVSASNLNSAFAGCRRLRIIEGGIIAPFANLNGAFSYCKALEEVRLNRIGASISFWESPKLSLASLSYLVENAANSSPITITVHPDVYAKLTGDTSNAAAATLSAEELAQWSALPAAAAAKNISFATV